MLAVALPDPRFIQIGHVRRTATRALHNAIGPAVLNHERLAVLVVGKELNGFEKVHVSGHVVRLQESAWSVKYIYAEKNREKLSLMKRAMLVLALFAAVHGAFGQQLP